MRLTARYRTFCGQTPTAGPSLIVYRKFVQLKNGVIAAEAKTNKNNADRLQKELNDTKNNAQEKTTKLLAQEEKCKEKQNEISKLRKESESKELTIYIKNINKLEQKLKASEAAIKNAKNDAQEKTNKLSAEEKKCTEKKHEISKLSKEIENWSKKYDVSEKDHEIKINSLTHEIETSKNNEHHLTKTLQEQEAMLNRVKTDALEKNKKISAAEKKCIEIQHEISKLTENIENSSQKYAKLNQKHETLCAESNAKIKTLTAAAESNEKKLKDYEAIITNAKHDAEERSANILEEEKKWIEKGKEISKLAKDNEAWTKKYNKLEQNHKTMSSELSAKMSVLTAEVETYKNTADRLTKKLNESEAALNNAKNHAEEKGKKLVAEEQKCVKQQKEIGNWSEKFAQMEQNHEQICTELKDKISNLTGELDTNENNIDRLTSKLKEYESAIKQAKKDGHEKDKEISKLIKDRRRFLDGVDPYTI